MPAGPEATGNQQRPLLVALTGGIASGKTAVSDRLEKLGAVVIDTDLIAREVVEPGQPGLEALVAAFGSEILDEAGKLNRGEMRRRIFTDAASRKTLEQILHPLIVDQVTERINSERNAPYLLLVVPLLVETGLFTESDRIVIVDVPEAVQLQRLTNRDGLAAEHAERMLAAQASRRQRLEAATDVIDNSGDIKALDVQVNLLHQRLLEAARAKST
ncbi:MAG: dephospho-CoA kinase [Wenzhouxiangella sp.]|nr:dephospho-CoA kinase [Wenzhouxiangella sp.]MCH8477567.1 dephospho-CoA kinase [Wenzhouxiangella sp.]TVR97287.1 MAG: dephospho-CoA kinase [Wenzhouxiangellaceae bacterium]